MRSTLESYVTVCCIFIQAICCFCGGEGGVCGRRICHTSGPEIRFPFRLKNESSGCGYSGFELSCNSRSQTVLTLPASGEFILTNINYSEQTIQIRDPNRCLPNRMIRLSLAGSPFQPLYRMKYTFLNCSITGGGFTALPGLLPIPCLSAQNYTVIARSFKAADLGPLAKQCLEMFTVSVPVERSVYEYGYPWDLGASLTLAWMEPSCSTCERTGGICMLKNVPTLHITCSRRSRSGLPLGAKYGIIIGVGIPGLVFIIGILCFVLGKIRAYNGRHRGRDVEISPSSIATPPAATWRGLDIPIIDSLPKTILGESRRMAGPNDGSCPICLSEYEPKETLRTIPECGHCFHLACVDEWLKLNASCPLCRNSPGASSRNSIPTTISFGSSSSS